MASDNNIQVMQTEHSHILYDVSLIANPETQLFQQNPSSGTKYSDRRTDKTAIGRAPVVFFSYQGRPMVLKHYYRGGLVAKLVSDWYLGARLENTRAYREWCLLRTMKNLNLPVPVPVAASVIKKLFCYRADLITLELEHTKTLADCLIHNPVSQALWAEVGACIKQFHKHNIYHADLNARNILLADSECNAGPEDNSRHDNSVYLIDFDRGAVRRHGGAWQKANLKRLLRSLNKFKHRQESFFFTEENWLNLLAGYNQG